MKQKGLVIVYTGNGKGKTTAALGLALRAIGHGQKVFMIQFMKGNENYGEIKSAKKYLPEFTIVQKGLDRFVRKNGAKPEDIALASEGIELAKKVVTCGNYDLVILDEINVAVDYGLVAEEKVIELIKLKPKNLTLVLTGRYASKTILDMADTISEIKDIKHHYKSGIKAQPGIEY